jgi:dTDP-4-amino-4,6-dideoxygalactose transaminase
VTVPFLNLARMNSSLKPAFDDAYRRVMDSGWYIMGQELTAFESEFATYSGVKHCIGVGNGLDALVLLLRAYGVGPGDEVLVPSNTFIATWLAVSQVGATPVPVEPDPATYNMDVLLAARAITPRTRVIMPVHLYGQTADMDPLMALATQHELLVIEDAAQSQGARYKDRLAGGLGHSAGTSFYPGKNLGALGDAGAVLTNNDEVANRVRMLRNYGSCVKYEHEQAGVNSRLDELQAAFLREKLRMLELWNEKRRRLAGLYDKGLHGIDGLRLPTVASWALPVWHLYVVATKQREALRAHLEHRGIGTVIHYPKPPHLQSCYPEFASSDLPIATRLAGEVLSLPMSPDMTDAEVAEVVSAVCDFFVIRN